MSTDPISPDRNHEPRIPIDVPARVLGVLIFLVGMGLLGYVFWSANQLLHLPPPTIAESGKTGTATTSSAALNLGTGLVQFGQQMIVLLLMCLVGSVIASIGMRVYFRARPMRR